MTVAEQTNQQEARRAGLQLVERLGGPWVLQFRSIVTRTARTWSVDVDDLHQATLERLLRQNTVDPTHAAVLGWVATAARYAALELRRRGARFPRAVEEEELERHLTPVVDAHLDSGAVSQFLDEVLTTGQRAVYAALVDPETGDRSQRKVAELLGRQHAAVRQDKKRGADRICRALGLSAAERRVVQEDRRGVPVEVTARRLRVPVGEVFALRAQARRKIGDRLW